MRYAGFLFGQKREQEAYAHLTAQADAGVGAPLALDQVVAFQLRSNELEAARATYERLARDFPNDPRTELAKGRIAMAEGRNDDAALALRHYVGAQETAEGQQLLALTELRRTSIPAAVAAIDRAIALSPAPALDAMRIKAAIHAAGRDHAQTIQTLNRIQRESGKLQDHEKLLYAQALYDTGRRPGAKALLEELLAGDDASVNAMLEFAQREGGREPERARGYLAKVRELQPANPQALRMQAQMDLGAGNADQALARIDEAAKSKPLTPALLLLRAQILASRQDYAGAEEEARRAFAAAPSLSGALELLASLYVAQDRVDEAIASFVEAEKAGALPPSGQQLLARLYLTAGPQRGSEAALREGARRARGSSRREERPRLDPREGGQRSRARPHSRPGSAAGRAGERRGRRHARLRVLEEEPERSRAAAVRVRDRAVAAQQGRGVAGASRVPLPRGARAPGPGTQGRGGCRIRASARTRQLPRAGGREAPARGRQGRRVRSRLAPDSGMRRLPTAALLLVVVACGGVVRSLHWPEVFLGDATVFPVGDTYYHLRRAEFGLAHPGEVLLFDPLVNHPDGSWVPWPPLHTLLLTATAALLGGSKQALEQAAAWYPVAIGAATAVPVFGAARVIAGPGTAILAATIAALLPAGAIYSELANADHHCSVAFFGAVWLWGALLALRTAPRRRVARRRSQSRSAAWESS